jgi:hypothetical protein
MIEEVGEMNTDLGICSNYATHFAFFSHLNLRSGEIEYEEFKILLS